MARQVSEVTQQEVEAYAKFAQEHGIINDDSEENRANAELVLNYFLNTWPNVISHQTLTQAFPALKPHLKFKSAAQLDAEKAARENSTIWQKFANWFDAQDLIVKEGDDGFLNFAQLIRELRGRDVTTDTIFQAMGRISYRPGRPLVYVTKKRKEVDPSYRPGIFIDPAEANLSPAEHARRARAAFDEKRDPPAVISQREQAAAKSEAEGLRGRSHSETDQLSRSFVTDPNTNEIDWIATRDARLQMQRRFERRHEVSYRI